MNNPLSLNLYTYVQNNPLIYTDPSGYAPCYSESQCKQLDEKLGLSSSTSYKRVDEMSYGELMDILMDPTASAKDQAQVTAFIFTHYVLGATAIKEIKALTSGIKGPGNAFTTTQNAAKSVGKELGGTVPELKNGWKVEILNDNKPIVVRIMNEGSGGRSNPYFKVSIDGKGSLT